MSLVIQSIQVKADQSTNGKTALATASAKKGVNFFRFDGAARAEAPPDFPVAVAKATSRGKMSFRIVKQTRVMVRWEWSLSGGLTPKTAGCSANYSYVFKVRVVGGKLIKGAHGTALPARKTKEKQTPIYTLAAGNYTMEAKFELVARVPPKKNCRATSILHSADFSLLEVGDD